MSSNKITYKDAGVDINAGNELVNRIKPFAKATTREGSDQELGGFGGLFDLTKTNYKNPVLVSGTDGVGTKLKLAFQTNKHDTIGIDLVAMCVNDIIVQGAEPLFFMDYYATSKLNIDVAEKVIHGIAEGCKISGCTLLGGETAEMPGMYQEGHYDLAGFAVGVVEKENILPKKDLAENDVLIGLPSSGLHSNGFSMINYILKEQGIKLEEPAPFNKDKPLAEELLAPTEVYVKPLLPHLHKMKALVHITGGGFIENIPRVLSKEFAVEIDASSWKTQSIFKWIAETANIEEKEMLKTFNCGIGMVLIVGESNVEDLMQKFDNQNVPSHIIGRIKKREIDAVEIKNLNNLYD